MPKSFGHDETVKRLQDWIAKPRDRRRRSWLSGRSEYMAQLARDAGFQKVSIVTTDGKPGVFATLDAGAPRTVGLYFMYDVKQSIRPSGPRHCSKRSWSTSPVSAR